jgi:carbon storage regulator
MLVLSRKTGESIVIGDCIVISVQRIEGGRVSIGITAPRDVRIDRAEIAELRSNAKPIGSPVPVLGKRMPRGSGKAA